MQQRLYWRRFKTRPRQCNSRWITNSSEITNLPKFYHMLQRLLYIIFIISVTIASCTFTQKIKDGTMAYERMQYSVAAKMLKNEYTKEKRRTEKGKKAFMIGESYKRMDDIEKASEWFLKAYEGSYGVDALKEHSYALKKLERYEEAAEAFKNLGIEIGSPYEYRREITACKQAMAWKESNEDTGYTIEASHFNSSSADYAPTLYENNQIIFTSDRNSASGEEEYNWTGRKFSDLFVTDVESGSPSSFSNNINTDNNEGTVAFNNDFTEMYFSRCYSVEKFADNYCKLMMSRRDGDTWSPAVVMPFVEDNVNYGHPSLSRDGSTLYFSSNHKDGWGGYDIYTSEKTGDGWSDPKILSRNINTLGDEKFPFIDNDTLYFASNFHPGMGGLDVFKSYKIDSKRWSPIQNLKPPINSGADDFGYIIDYSKQKAEDVIATGYFTTSRSSGKGMDDIFKFEKRTPPPPPPAPEPEVDSTETIPPPIVFKMILEGYVLEKIYQDKNNPNSKVLGRKPLDAATVNINIGNNKETVKVGPDGFFSIELEEETDYYFFAMKEGYLNNDTRFSSKGLAKDPSNPETKYEVEIVLDKIFKNVEITLENIYYDYDAWDIRSDAQPTLNELSTLISQNPTLKIQLSSHTDCRGPGGYNEDLSQKRAQSAVDYLISKGIPAERLVAKGYGETLLSVDCLCTRCSEEDHQANRRTTFKIIE